ncbi:MAG: COX15/CtaA family protein [Bordetella sp.]|nr:MAG: COX15/CtaA family protein [Bordetella sp.]
MSCITNIYRRLIFFTFFLTIELIVFGAFVRLTNSGLGCPDWPGCYGQFSPYSALQNIKKESENMPFGPVNIFKAWIEMIHRYIASILGLLIFSIFIIGYFYQTELNQSPLLALITFITVCIQGAFGAWTVTHLLMPIIVTAHLLFGILTLGLITILKEKLFSIKKIDSDNRKLMILSIIGLVLICIQIGLGGWVSSNYATLACTDFPKCQGKWFPDMNFNEGFYIMRELGISNNGELISQNALTAIHWVHRNFAFIIISYFGFLCYFLIKRTILNKMSMLILSCLIIQLLTGLSIVFLESPLLFGILHHAGSIGLFLSNIIMIFRISKLK